MPVIHTSTPSSVTAMLSNLGSFTRMSEGGRQQMVNYMLTLPQQTQNVILGTIQQEKQRRDVKSAASEARKGQRQSLGMAAGIQAGGGALVGGVAGGLEGALYGAGAGLMGAGPSSYLDFQHIRNVGTFLKNTEGLLKKPSAEAAQTAAAAEYGITYPTPETGVSKSPFGAPRKLIQGTDGASLTPVVPTTQPISRTPEQAVEEAGMGLAPISQAPKRLAASIEKIKNIGRKKFKEGNMRDVFKIAEQVVALENEMGIG